MDKEKLFVLSVLVAHDGQNDEVQIEDEGSLGWKRKKGLDSRSRKWRGCGVAGYSRSQRPIFVFFQDGNDFHFDVQLVLCGYRLLSHSPRITKKSCHRHQPKLFVQGSG
jgi:hypothetical protein